MENLLEFTQLFLGLRAFLCGSQGGTLEAGNDPPILAARIFPPPWTTRKAFPIHI
jgi:hypothetical protein